MESQRVGNDWATFTFLFEDWNNLSFPPNFQVQYSLLCLLNSLRIYCQHGAQWLWILQCVTPQNIIETRMWLLTNSDHVIIWSYAISSVSSVQWLSHVRLFVTHESQHARPPCPSPNPEVHSNSRPSCQWCHPAISSSVVPFSSCP